MTLLPSPRRRHRRGPAGSHRLQAARPTGRAPSVQRETSALPHRESYPEPTVDRAARDSGSDEAIHFVPKRIVRSSAPRQACRAVLFLDNPSYCSRPFPVERTNSPYISRTRAHASTPMSVTPRRIFRSSAPSGEDPMRSRAARFGRLVVVAAIARPRCLMTSTACASVSSAQQGRHLDLYEGAARTRTATRRHAVVRRRQRVLWCNIPLPAIA